MYKEIPAALSSLSRRKAVQQDSVLLGHRKFFLRSDNCHRPDSFLKKDLKGCKQFSGRFELGACKIAKKTWVWPVWLKNPVPAKITKSPENYCEFGRGKKQGTPLDCFHHWGNTGFVGT